MRRIVLRVLAVAAVAVAGASVLGAGSDEYELKVLMPSADGTYVGGKVMLDGRQVGRITDVGVHEDKALITAMIEDEYAPVHAGTTARVSWESVIGARVLELLPGPRKNPEFPSGKLIESKFERVELDDVLAALDAPTRTRLHGLLEQLNETLQGREHAVNATVRSAGPAVGALGEVMRAVGEDGPAIRDLVKRLHAMTSELAKHDDDLRQTVTDLGQLTSATAGEQESLKAALGELPATVREAKTTFDRVPAAVNAAVPLLNDLRPATAKLPRVVGNLSPVLTELRPTVADLRPTLASTRSLLRHTPALLDSTHATLPGVNDAVITLQPAASFLRPYTPELAGWLSNWTQVFAPQNSAGNYGRLFITESGASFNDNPGVLPPGLKQDRQPAPGSIVGQPWTDANGDGVR